MNAIDTFPDPAIAVRERLPQFRPETAERLVAWAQKQPGSMPWLLKRADAYWGRHGPDAALQPAEMDAHHQRIEAVCALELLSWRTGARNDREAVEHLGTALEKNA